MNEPLEIKAKLHMRLRSWLADDALRRLFGNVLVLLGGKAFNALFSLGTMTLAVRALGLETYGVLILIHAFAMTAADLGKFQSWQAVLRYGTSAVKEDRLDDFRRLIRFTLLLDAGSALAATVVAMTGAWLIGPRLGWPTEVIPLGVLYGFSVIFAVTATPTGLLRLYDRFDLLAIQNNVGSLVRLIGSAIVFLAGGGLPAFIAVWFVARAASGISLFLFGWREMRRHGHGGTGAVGWRGLTKPFDGIWRFVWSTNLNTTANLGFVHLATLLTGGLLGPEEAGLFRIARQVANALAKPARLFIQVVYPEFARLVAAGDLRQLRRLLRRLAGLSAGGTAVGLLLLVVFGPLLLRLIGGEAALAAYPILLWLSGAALIDLWAFPLEPALISLGRAGTALMVRATATAVSIPFLILAVRHFGLTGAGITALATALLLLIGQFLPTLRAFEARQ